MVHFCPAGCHSSYCSHTGPLLVHCIQGRLCWDFYYTCLEDDQSDLFESTTYSINESGHFKELA